MDELDRRFMEEYKKIHHYCKERYNEKNAVKLYLLEMKEKADSGKKVSSLWEHDFHSLKRLRFLRNQLKFENVYGICEENDIAEAVKFAERFETGRDPLSLWEKAEKKAHRAQMSSAGPKGETEDKESSFPGVGNVFRELTKNKTGIAILAISAMILILLVLLVIMIVTR